MTENQTQAAQQYLEAGKAAAAEARKEGTPEYDPRAHQYALELERRAAERMETEDLQAT